MTQTYDENDGVGATDSLSGPITLASNDEHLSADFAYGPIGGTIGDRVWVDANGDGVEDAGEPGLSGVIVNLKDDNGIIDTQTTDANGNYLFTGLPTSNAVYIVEIDNSTIPSGYTAHDLGDPDVRDGNSQTADETTVIVFTDTQTVNVEADFGYLPDASQNNSIVGQLWNDTNSDNIASGAEQGISGVTLQLIDVATGNIVANSTTDANGNYMFGGLPDGEYDVKVTDASSVLLPYSAINDADGVLTQGVIRVDLDCLIQVKV